MSKLSKKQRHQVKSRWYYIFWGAATLSVFAGQLYVGTGYRRMSKSIDDILEAPIIIESLPGLPRHRGHIMPVPDTWEEEGMWHPTDPPQRIW